MIPGVFPPYKSSGSLGPGRGNRGNNKLVLQLALRGCSTIGVLITAGNLNVTEISSGQLVASKIITIIKKNFFFCQPVTFIEF